MKSFGIGLALLLSGFATYVLTSVTRSMAYVLTILSRFLNQLKEAGAIPEGVTLPQGWETLATGGIPLSIINIGPYIGLGIMFFGVAWFWMIEPLLYLTSPPKREAPPPPSAPRGPRAEPTALSGKDIERWIAEAIWEKIERERGK